MIKQWSSTILALTGAINFSFVATIAVGDIIVRFPVTRDIGIWAESSEQMTTSGKQRYIRPLKLLENAAVMDFDTDAMSAFLLANPGPATWTFNLFNSDVTSGFPPSGDLGVVTVESTNDWVEGNSNGLDQFGWTEGTPSATYFYAQTVYETSTGSPLVVTGESLQWIDPDSGPYTFTGSFPDLPSVYGIPGTREDWNLNPTPEFTNSADFLNADIAAAGLDGGPFSVIIDDDIINALITDVNNRGLRFGPLANGQFTNWKIWGREQSESAPYLEVTIETPPAGPGDFDEDGDVDGDDFLLWQTGGSPNGITADDLAIWKTNFGTLFTTATTSSVPEPSTILLVALGTSLLLGAMATSADSNMAEPESDSQR